MLRKGLAVAVILLFIGVAFAPSINANLSKSCIAPMNDGNLSGYVYDSNMEPIEGALVRVDFHSEYEENYTDSNGYYHVSNIPLCFCLKNCSASKVDYVTEWAYLEIIEETFYDFVLEGDDDCGCNDESQPLAGNFPIICGILLPITMLSMYMNLWMNPMGMGLLFIVLINIAVKLGCDWLPEL